MNRPSAWGGGTASPLDGPGGRRCGQGISRRPHPRTGGRPQLPSPDPKRVSRLLDDLSDNRFSVRQKATDELERLHDLAEPTLRDRLAENPALETRRRI